MKEAEKNIVHLKHQLVTANITINQLKEKLKLNSDASLEMDKHVLVLKDQICELLEKVKAANIKHSENAEIVATLKETISSMEHVSCFNI